MGYASAAYSTWLSTYFTPVQHHTNGLTTINDRSQLSATSVTLKKLRVHTSRCPRTVTPGARVDHYININGVNSPLWCRISDFETTACDLKNEAHISPGDSITMRNEPSADQDGYADWSFIAESDNPREIPLFGSTAGSAYHTSTTQYGRIEGAIAPATNVSYTYHPVPIPGTMKNLYVEVPTAPGAGKSVDFTLQKNGVNTGLSVNIADANTTGNDTDAISLVQGDYINLIMVKNGNPATSTARWGFTFVSENDTDSMLLFGSSSTLSQTSGDTYYNQLAATGAMSTTETTWDCIMHDCIISRFFIKMYLSPGVAGTGWDFTARKNYEDTPLVISLREPEATDSNTINQAEFKDNDMSSMKIGTFGSPNNFRHWGGSYKCVVGERSTLHPEKGIGGYNKQGGNIKRIAKRHHTHDHIH